MENNNKRQVTKEKVKETFYVDIDGVIINDIDVVIDILNERYKIAPKKTITDLKDWEYRSIYNRVSRQEIIDIYQSNEFFGKLEVNNDFLNFYRDNKDTYNFVCITMSSVENCKRKRELFDKFGLDIEIIRTTNWKNTLCLKGIQVDDNYKNFNFGNKKLMKILLTNGINTDYNFTHGGEENFYIVNNWNDIKDIMQWRDYLG